MEVTMKLLLEIDLYGALYHVRTKDGDTSLGMEAARILRDLAAALEVSSIEEIQDFNRDLYDVNRKYRIGNAVVDN
jgi:hypothetical protein